MIMQRTVPVLAAALLLAAGGVWADPPDDSNAGERVETPRAEPQESPSEPPPQAQAPDPPSSPEPSTPPSDSGSGDDDSSSGHTAVPTGPDDRGHGPNRQPPTHHGGGNDDGNDDGGGIYDGPGDEGYEDDSPQSAGSPYSLPHFLGGGRGSRADMGALDLDISPARTKVYLEGQPIGKVDDFDGWPKYLWLPAGTYNLVFYLDGYQTLGRRMTVRPALVVDMNDHLQPGRSIRPEDFRPEPRK